MNHHKFNYLSSGGAARSSSNCSHSSKLTSARFSGNTAANVAQSPIINFTSPLPSSSSSSLPNNTTTTATMNAMTSTYSPLSSSSGRYPIRLSPSALPYFISTIIYTIEFHAPVGPRPLPSDIASKSSSVTSRIFLSSNSNNNYNNRSTRSSLQVPRNSSIAINDRRHGSLQLEDNNNNNNINSSFAESTAMINALPSSVFSAVSAIFGRTPLQALTPQLKPQNMSTSPHYIHEHNNYGCNDSGVKCTGEDELGYHEELIIDDEVLRRAREQPLVSPCTQIIHELGNVHIVVRERHNPTVEMAYNQALCDIRMILGRCREKMEKELRVRSQSQQQQQQQRFHSSFTANRLASSQWSNNTNIIDNNSINNKKEIPTISVYGNESMNDPAMSMPAYCCSDNSNHSDKVNIGQTGHNNKNDCTSNNNSSNRNVLNNNSSRFAASPPITYSTSSLLPLSEPPSLMRLESPSIRHDSNTIQNSSNRLSNNCNNYKEKPYYDVQPDEVGMYLSVRLLTRETK